MKIAIMTQPLGRNYGGMMQAYALQKVLRDMGHEVMTINHHASAKGAVYNLARLGFRLLKKATLKRKLPVNVEKHYSYIFKDTQAFVDKHIVQSEYIDNDKDLKLHFYKNKYDAVIVGSDQTWRPMYSPNIYNYYLDFLENDTGIKKIAYASSFGVDIWEYSVEETRRCAELAKLFNAISVREQSGIDFCKKHLGVDSECVLDPTLLLDKEDYLALIGDRYKGAQNEGVFTYFLDTNEEKESASEQLAKKLDTFTFKSQAKLGLGGQTSRDIDDYKMPAVEDWLASFANAEYILTDSFHGVVFSIVFNKPFIAIGNHNRGLSRFHSLLSKLDLMDRLIVDDENILDRLKEEIAYIQVNSILINNKLFSSNFLRTYI